MKSWVWAFGAGLVCAAMVSSGCARRKPAEAAGNDSGAATQLGSQVAQDPQFELWLVPADKDGSPVFSPSIGGRELELTRSPKGFNWYVPETLSLDQGGHAGTFFFAVPESSLGAAVVQADFQFRTEGDPIRERSLERQPMSNDPEAKIWFIPLTQLLGNAPWSSGPELTHELTLDFVLEDGRRLVYRIAFHATAPLPQGLGAVTTVSALPGDINGLARTAEKGGHEVAQTRVSNPLKHDAEIYLRAVDSGFEGEVQVARGYCDATACDAENSFNPQRVGPETTIARFRVSRARITRNGQSQTIDFEPGKWIGILLHAGESAGVGWVAAPIPGTPVCSMTRTQAELDAAAQQTGGTYLQKSWFHFSRFHGVINEIQTRLTDPTTAVSEATSDTVNSSDQARISATSAGPYDFDSSFWANSLRFKGHWTLPCQGIF